TPNSRKCWLLPAREIRVIAFCHRPGGTRPRDATTKSDRSLANPRGRHHGPRQRTLSSKEAPMKMRSRLAGLIIVSAATTDHLVWPAQSRARPTPTVDIHQLQKMKGPKVPAGATKLGKQEQPMVGDVKLPIQNVDVYQFPVRTQKGLVVPVNWAYVPGTGTYLWASAPIQCTEGTVVPNGSYAMRIKEDGSGGDLPGHDQSPQATSVGDQ